jgi:hypothetical protein
MFGLKHTLSFLGNAKAGVSDMSHFLYQIYINLRKITDAN